MAIPFAELNKINPSSIIELFELELLLYAEHRWKEETATSVEAFGVQLAWAHLDRA